MKLHILSDLHIELCKYVPHPIECDAVVLAGDIGRGPEGIVCAREMWPKLPIIYIAGNHEFYRCADIFNFDRPSLIEKMRETAFEEGVHFLDNDELILNDVRILGSTLWTDFLLHGEGEKTWDIAEGNRFLNDFRSITESLVGNKLFTPSRSIELNTESIAWIKARLDVKVPRVRKTVLVTHHLPSMQSVADRYKNEPLSACFASNHDEIFGKYDLHIHGHTHDSFDYLKNCTRVVCNPQGYQSYNGIENSQFDPELVIEI